MADTARTGAQVDASFRWGIYEKALPREASWPEMLSAAASAGYQFVEISIDESDERLARLEWPPAERRAFHAALAGGPASVDTMCLSGHRRFALGSASKPQREKALLIMRRAIDFAAEFGIRIVQVAGYDVHSSLLQTPRAVCMPRPFCGARNGRAGPASCSPWRT
jgi:L-ribulose-5-phosphate 3-epimerase UlaE